LWFPCANSKVWEPAKAIATVANTRNIVFVMLISILGLNLVGRAANRTAVIAFNPVGAKARGKLASPGKYFLGIQFGVI
jgi:hypothetical protein